MNEDLELRRRLPNECWSRVISFLPRISRQSLAFLYGFREIVDGELRNFLMLHDFNDFFLFQTLPKWKNADFTRL